MGNLGQDEDFEYAKEKAKKIGAIDCIVGDLRETFMYVARLLSTPLDSSHNSPPSFSRLAANRDDYIVPAMQSNAVYESRYLMGTSLARPCIAKGAMQAAVDYGCGALAHGATGKGNDQVRFELSFYALAPRINVVAPWRNQEFLDKFQGRNDMLEYAKEKGIPIEGHGQAKPFSMDDVGFLVLAFCVGEEEELIKSPPHAYLLLAHACLDRT